MVNRPFYRYVGHIELIGFKEDNGMPKGHEHDPIYPQQYLRALFGPIFLYVFLARNIDVLCLDVKMIAFFPRNIHWSSLLDRKACVNTERVPPGHPIILLKSTKLKYGPHIGKKVYYIVLHFIVKLNLQLTVIGFISVDDFLYADHTILLVCTCVHVLYIYYS